jgi:hypothetical protein
MATAIEPLATRPTRDEFERASKLVEEIALKLGGFDVCSAFDLVDWVGSLLNLNSRAATIINSVAAELSAATDKLTVISTDVLTLESGDKRDDGDFAAAMLARRWDSVHLIVMGTLDEMLGELRYQCPVQYFILPRDNPARCKPFIEAMEERINDEYKRAKTARLDKEDGSLHLSMLATCRRYTRRLDWFKTVHHLRKEREAIIDLFPAGVDDESKAETASEFRLRPAFDRDHKWLGWYEDSSAQTFHSHAKIRDCWNEMSDEQRMGICSTCSTQVGKGEPGRRVVVQAITKAKKEREAK